MKNNIDLSMYTITPLEKEAAVNICNLIMKSLRSLTSISSSIIYKTSELKNIPNTSEAYETIRENLEFNIENLKDAYIDEFLNATEHCDAFVNLFVNRKHLNTNIKNIYDIAYNISDDGRYMIKSSEFDYSSLTLLVSDMGKYIERFKKIINSL